MPRIEQVRASIGTALDLSTDEIESMDFIQLLEYADIIVCKRFENHPMEWTFTEESWRTLNELIAIKFGKLL